MGVRHLEIDQRHAGQRLDNYLIGRLKGVPKSRIYRILRKGEVRLNGKRARPDQRLVTGDVVRLPPVRVAAPTNRLATIDDVDWLADRVLYEDEHLLVVDKPAGLAVHGGTGLRTGLIESLRHWRPQAPMLELAHRLDRATSGCLLIAKDRATLLALHAMLRHADMAKRYLALVQGEWAGGARTVSAPLAKEKRGGEHVIGVTDSGKSAATRFILQRRYPMASLMNIELFTGRMHQARAHAAHLGHPIAGDEKYGDRGFNRRMRGFGLRRLFLHAHRLGFRHPMSGCQMHIEAPLPADLANVLERLGHES
jgi:23S rRNA pseudouridine955/2504/2580 synthase